jgi:ribosomal protein S18 acetylase RimI-like enzyme
MSHMGVPHSGRGTRIALVRARLGGMDARECGRGARLAFWRARVDGRTVGLFSKGTRLQLMGVRHCGSDERLHRRAAVLALVRVRMGGGARPPRATGFSLCARGTRLALSRRRQRGTWSPGAARRSGVARGLDASDPRLHGEGVPARAESTTDSGVRRASARDATAVASVLSRAFESDPFLRYLLRDDPRRDDGRRTFFDVAVRVTLAQGEVWTTDDFAGASLFMGPGRWRFGFWTELLSARGMVHATSLARALRSWHGFRALKRVHPVAPHYYLFFLGVDPHRHGGGIGSSLLAPMLARCANDRMPAYLENSNPTNERFYERHGFAVTRVIDVGRGAPPVGAMWRQATEGDAA